MVLGGIAGATALVVFFAGFLVAVGLLGPTPAPVPAGPTGAGSLAKGVTQVAPGLATLQKDIPGLGKATVRTETGDVSIANTPGVGQLRVPGPAPGASPGPAPPAAATVPPPAAPAASTAGPSPPSDPASAAGAQRGARAPAGLPGANPPSSVPLPASPPPVASDDSGAAPAVAPVQPRAALPGAIAPRATAPPPAAPPAGAPPAGAPPAAAPPAAPPRASAGAGRTADAPAAASAPQRAGGSAGAPLRILPSGPPSAPPAAGAGGPGGASSGSGGGTGYAIQVGAFLTAAHATRLSDDLQKRGHDARVVVETDTSGRSWHIVRVGRFTDRYSAVGAANRLKSAEGVPTMVVTELGAGPALR